MPNISQIINILFSATGTALLVVGLIKEMQFAKLAENKTQKMMWWAIIFMVFIFIFSFSSFTITLIIDTPAPSL